ncbi:ORF22 [Agrotis segetum granulovirus]|uniref:ORF22 n=1 Tax=Agrotis segetum granulosis virus TaxID=10464 RepID=Q9WHE9_GVAS|nr:unknown [Agrotis segetum granulovirus]AAS82716.1 ORF22 [Agrotis segetum granulovirus]
MVSADTTIDRPDFAPVAVKVKVMDPVADSLKHNAPIVTSSITILPVINLPNGPVTSLTCNKPIQAVGQFNAQHEFVASCNYKEPIVLDEADHLGLVSPKLFFPLQYKSSKSDLPPYEEFCKYLRNDVLLYRRDAVHKSLIEIDGTWIPNVFIDCENRKLSFKGPNGILCQRYIFCKPTAECKILPVALFSNIKRSLYCVTYNLKLKREIMTDFDPKYMSFIVFNKKTGRFYRNCFASIISRSKLSVRFYVMDLLKAQNLVCILIKKRFFTAEYVN